jgi:hypothetical protein
MNYIFKMPGFLKRILIFQFVFVVLYLKFTDISKAAYEFKDKSNEVNALFGVKNPAFLDELLKNPIQLFQILLGFQLISAILAILGSRIFAFITGLLVLIYGLTHNNPYISYTKHIQSQKDGQNNFWIPNLGLILNIALVSGIWMIAFQSNEKLPPVLPEAGTETSRDTRTPKQTSKNKKKHI